MTETLHTRGKATSRSVNGLWIRSAALTLALATPLSALPGAALLAPGAFAQSRPIGNRTYLNPFPQTDRYQIYVIGDSLAEGLAQGLDDAFQKESSVKIFNYGRPSSGMASLERFDWAAEVGRLTQSQPVHAAVILMGLNDQRTARAADGAYQKWGTPGWADAYGKNVERLIKKLKAADVAIYWVGLPIMAKAGANEAVDTMNNVVREKCYLNGAKYIEAANGFTDQFGAYTIYGPDITGQQKRLRDTDGEHFTFAGYRKLASYVDVVIRRDLTAARGERNIPLAGDETEQSKVSPHAAAPAQQQTDQDPKLATTAGDNKSVKQKVDGVKAEGARSDPPAGKTDPQAAPHSGMTEAAKQQGTNLSQSGTSPGGLSSAGSSSVAETLAAGPSAGSSPQGELIAGDRKSGVTALATISSFFDMSLKVAQRRTPLAERTYYKVLVKGESLKPKAGRTDDFKWPRS